MKLNTLIPKIHTIFDAKIAWRMLNGVFAIYKPPGVTYLNTRDIIIQHLCKGKKVYQYNSISCIFYTHCFILFCFKSKKYKI